MKEEPPLDAKCRDKFLVQSVLTSPDQDPNVTTLWQQVEKTAKASISEKKIRVNFLAAVGASTNGTLSSSQPGEEQPPAYSSPSPQFGSPGPVASSSTPAKSSSSELGRGGSSSVAEATGITAAAKAHIQKLTAQVQDPQFRQRKAQQASEKVQTVVQQSNESGVPLQIVAGLCLLSFLIAYLFF